jgi:predicted thioredoxin/glutaredoxin
MNLNFEQIGGDYAKDTCYLCFEEEGIINNILAKLIEKDKYVLLESCLFSETYKYGVLIEAVLKDGELWIRDIIEESDFTTHTFVLNEDFIKSPQVQQLLNSIVNFGGAWDVAMKGVLSVYFYIGLNSIL